MGYKKSLLSLALLFGGLTVTSQPGAAQSTTTAQPPANVQVANQALGSIDSGSSQSVPDFLLQHLQFMTADTITHYRYMDKAPGDVTARDEFYKVSVRTQVNLLGDGTTYLQMRGESGRSFAASYDYTGIGMHAGYWSFNMKSLYLGQKIGNHFEAQVGGVEFDRGAGTEMTSADNDGWLEGYRLVYAGQGHKDLPDKISATVGYVGDFEQPNVFSRFHRMGDENYIQILGQKGLGKNRDVSAEFNSIQGIRYNREAFRWQKLHNPFVQGMQVETLTRFTDASRFGWASSLYHDFARNGRLRAAVFYSDIPKTMFMKGDSTIFYNGDRYATGKRVGPLVTVVPFKNFEVTAFGGKRLDNTPSTRNRGEICVRYQLASLLNRVMR